MKHLLHFIEDAKNYGDENELNSPFVVLLCDDEALGFVEPYEDSIDIKFTVADDAEVSEENYVSLFTTTDPDNKSKIHKIFVDDVDVTENIEIITVEPATSGGVSTYQIAIVNNLASGDHVAKVHFLGSIKVYTGFKETYAKCKSKEIKLPKQMSQLTSGTFANCTSLEAVTLSELTTDIPSGCFNGDARLKSVSNIDNIKTCGGQAFYGCASLESIELPNLTIANGGGTFNACTSLKNVELPKLTTINSGTFGGCSSIETLSLPMLSKMGFNEFSSCSSITELNLPKIEVLNGGALNGCSSLTTLNVDNLKYAYSGAFSGCSSLKNISLPKAIELQTGFLSGCSPETIDVPVLPYLTSSVFAGTSLKTINAQNIKCAYGAACSSCSSLTTFDAPNLKYAYDAAFSSCTRLTTFDAPNLVYIGQNGFYGCSALATFDAPNLVYIGQNGFYSCSSFTTLNFPKAEIIQSGAFTNCSSVTSAYFDGAKSLSNTGIQPRVLNALTNLTYLSVNSVVGELNNAYIPTGNLETISANSATSIASNCFASAKKLKSIYANSVQSIGNAAFAASSLIGASFDNAETVENNAFIQNYSLTGISLKKCKTIGRNAFDNCYKLPGISLPEAVSIDQYAFYNAYNMQQVDAPKLESIGYAGLYNCSSCTRVNMPNLKSIGGFINTGLTEIVMPSVTDVTPYAQGYEGYDAISSNTKLTYVSLPNLASVGSNSPVIRNNPLLTKLDLRGLKTLASPESIGTSTDWEHYYEINLEGLETLNYGLQLAKHLKSLNLPNIKTINPSSIGNYMSGTPLIIDEPVVFNSTCTINPNAVCIETDYLTISDKCTLSKYGSFYNSKIKYLTCPDFTATSYMNMSALDTVTFTGSTLDPSNQSGEPSSSRSLVNATTVNLQNTTTLGDFPIFKNAKFEEIVFPDTVVNYSDTQSQPIVNSCDNLKQLVLGQGMTRLSTLMVYPSAIGAALESITLRSLSVCDLCNISSITVATIKAWLDANKPTFKFLVPAALVSAYKSDEHWSALADYIFAM